MLLIRFFSLNYYLIILGLGLPGPFFCLSNCPIMKKILFFLFIISGISSCSNSVQPSRNPAFEGEKITKTDSAWKTELTPDEYAVLREKATESPYTGEYDQLWDTGIYVCKACGLELFRSSTKFDAGCGWPSFYQGIDKKNIKEVRDTSHGMTRIEIQCARCGGHLGHVFNDGPEEEGLRYCVNSLSLGFRKK